MRRSIGLRRDGSAAGLWICLLVGIAVAAPAWAAPQPRAAFALNPAGSPMLLRSSASRRLCGPPRSAPVLGFTRPISLLRTQSRGLGRLPLLMSSEEAIVEPPAQPEEVDIAADLAAQREKDEKLWAAAEQGDKDLIRILVAEEGADVNSQPLLRETEDDDEAEEFTESVELSEEDREAEATRKYERKLKKAADLAVEYDGKTEEEIKVLEEKARKKKLLRKKKAAAANKGPSALHLACAAGRTSAACTLVDLGADVNLLTDDLSTPLHLAVVKGHTDVVAALVTLGADLKAKNKLGKTPLGMGKEVGSSRKVMELLEELMTLMEVSNKVSKKPQ